MEEFIDYAKVVMGALGYKLFEPYDKQEKEQEDYGCGISTCYGPADE